jgi:MFS family permease
MFQTIAISVVFVYTIPYLTSIGMDRATAGVIVMLYTLVSISIRVPLGMLADRFVKKYVVAATIFLMAAGLVAFLFFRNDSPFWLILLFAVPFGLGLAGAQLLRQLIVRDYFGTKNLGIIFGLIGVAATIGSALSAPAAGLIIDTSHDYRTVWLISVASFILALVMIITIPSVKSGAKKNTPAE